MAVHREDAAGFTRSPGPASRPSPGLSLLLNHFVVAAVGLRVVVARMRSLV